MMTKVGCRLCVALVLAIIPSHLLARSGDGHSRQVLLLHSYHQGYRWTDGVTAGVIARLGNLPDFELHVEHMGSKHFDSPKYFAALHSLLKLKFGQSTGLGDDLKAVICSDDHALDFALKHRDELFGESPIVFCGINDFHPDRIAGHDDVTGVVESYDFRGTLGVMLRLHPETESIVIIGDQTKSGLAGIARTRRAAEFLAEKVHFDYLVGLPLEMLKERLAALSDKSLVLFVNYTRTGEGETLHFDFSRRAVASASPVPVYCPWDFVPDQGLFGGRGLSGRSQGAAVAEIVRRILNQEKAGSIPITYREPNPYMFDHGQLARFGIDESQLPPDSVIIGRPESTFGEYGLLIWGVLAFVLLQTGLIVILFALRVQRSRLERRLLESRKMEAIGRLAGGVAHDFRNQLTVIGGYCDMLAESLPEAGRDWEWVQQIRRGTKRSTTLTSQLLAFSRKETLRPRVADANRLLSELIPTLGRLIGEDVKLHFDSLPTLPAVEIDTSQFEQALMNLATNARDAMPNGGSLTIRTMIEELNLSALPADVQSGPGLFVRVDVEDDGLGMAADTMSRVFDPFFTTKAVGKGTGLGLSMVHGFVHQSGGFVKVWSSFGEGSSFSLYFPASTEVPEVTDELPETSEHAPGTETILVVEDDEAVLELVVETLSSHGYNVLHTTDPNAAEKLLEDQEQKVDLLFSDVVMPGLYGPDLATRLCERSPGLRVLYMSGYTRGSFEDKERLPHDVDLLEKPFTRERLHQAVRRALGQTTPEKFYLQEP